jgi:putative ABC transport system ATP-binding protein
MEITNTALTLENIHVSYPNTPNLLRIQYWEIKKGDKHLLHGSSGSGKSTLLSLISGIIHPQEGTVCIFGKNTTQMKAHESDRFRGENIGYIFQQFNLIHYLSVYENIHLSLYWNPGRKKRLRFKTIKDEISHLAEKLLIQNILNKKASQISVGQAQRVAVARALLGSPQLILADEPTSALDEEAKSEFLKLLFQLVDEQKSTLLFVSHDRSLKSYFTHTTFLRDLQK